MTDSLPDKLTAALAFVKDKARNESYRIDDEISAAQSEDYLDNHSFIRGAEWQHEKLVPLHKVLVECVRALECNETFHRLGGIDDCEPCKALAQLAEVLK